MTDFNERAQDWDKNEMHLNRSIAIAAAIEKTIPIHYSMRALEFGAGTGMLSFILKDKFSDITLMDNSVEMIKACEQKVEFYKTSHIHPVWFDLEHSNYDSSDAPFDLIYSQMVFHHILNIEPILAKLYSMLNPGGYLAIADLFTEDGSFHDFDPDVHYGFDPEELLFLLKKNGFKNGNYDTCFEIVRGPDKKYPLFLLTTNK